VYIVFDVGGTSTRVAVSRDGTKLDQVERFLTPRDPAQGVQEIITRGQALLEGASCTAVAGAIPGILNAERGALVFSPNLPQWLNHPLVNPLQQGFKCSVKLQNDAALAGLAEATIGAGKGHSIVAYLTISTGVGGDRIVHQQIDEAAFGLEPGQQLIDGEHTLEELVSGSNLKKRLGIDPREVTDEKIWEELAHCLAIGLNNVIVHWSPDIVVLGGSMMKSPGIALEAVQTHLEKIFTLSVPPPPLVLAALADTSGLEGARLVARTLSPI
jgi:glucokinase